MIRKHIVYDVRNYSDSLWPVDLVLFVTELHLVGKYLFSL